MNLRDKAEMLFERKAAHQRFQEDVSKASKRLTRALSKLHDREFTLEAKDAASVRPVVRKSRRTKPPTGKPNVTPRILADVPSDKIEAVQGVFKLEHGDSSKVKRAYRFSGRYTKAAIAARQVAARARARIRKSREKAVRRTSDHCDIRW